MRHSTGPWQERNADAVVVWTPLEPPQAIEGPLPLDLFADQLLVLELADGQLAIHEIDGKVVRVYLDGVHELDVGPGQNQIAPLGQLTFVRTGALLNWRWQNSSLLRIDLGGGNATEIPIRGACALAVADPYTLHSNVLSGLSGVPLDRLTGVLDTLVRSRLEQRLRDLVERQVLDRTRAGVLLERLSASDLDDDLAPLGLRCEHLGVISLATDLEEAPKADSGEPVACYDDIV